MSFIINNVLKYIDYKSYEFKEVLTSLNEEDINSYFDSNFKSNYNLRFFNRTNLNELYQINRYIIKFLIKKLSEHDPNNYKKNIIKTVIQNGDNILFNYMLENGYKIVRTGDIMKLVIMSDSPEIFKYMIELKVEYKKIYLNQCFLEAIKYGSLKIMDYLYINYRDQFKIYTYFWEIMDKDLIKQKQRDIIEYLYERYDTLDIYMNTNYTQKWREYNYDYYKQCVQSGKIEITEPKKNVLIDYLTNVLLKDEDIDFLNFIYDELVKKNKIFSTITLMKSYVIENGESKTIVFKDLVLIKNLLNPTIGEWIMNIFDDIINYPLTKRVVQDKEPYRIKNCMIQKLFDKNILSESGKIDYEKIEYYMNKYNIELRTENLIQVINNSNSTIEDLKKMIELKTPLDARLCEFCALIGRLDFLKFLHENDCPWNELTPINACKGLNLDCLEYVHQNGCPWNHGTWLMLHAFFVPNEKIPKNIYINNKMSALKILKYLGDNKCPQPQYEVSEVSNNENSELKE